MNRNLFKLAALSFIIFAQSCSDNGPQCQLGKEVPSCTEGKVRVCEGNSDKEARWISYDNYCNDKSERLSCEGDELRTHARLSCDANGQLQFCQNPNAASQARESGCDQDGQFVHCQGRELKAERLVCQGAQMLSCQDGSLKPQSEVLCHDGYLLLCQGQGDQAQVLKEELLCDPDGLILHCDGQSLKKDAAFCEDGKVNSCHLVDGVPVLQQNEVLCVRDDNIAFCRDNRLTIAQSVCQSNALLSCREGNSYTHACGNNVCQEFKRGELVTAGCFTPSSIVDGCGSLSNYGSCQENTLHFCNLQGDKALQIDCSARNRHCTKIDSPNDSYGYDCAIFCQDETGKQHTDFGHCDDKTLHYCTQTGLYKRSNCAKRCDFYEYYYSCLD